LVAWAGCVAFRLYQLICDQFFRYSYVGIRISTSAETRLTYKNEN
jgi:hypothetical protein